MYNSLLIWLERMLLDDVQRQGLKNLLIERNPIKLRTIPRRNIRNCLVFVYAWRSKDFRIVGIFLNRSIHNKELKFIEDELVEFDDYLILYNECKNNLEKYNCGKGLGPSPFQYIDERCTRNILKDCYRQPMNETTRKKLDKIMRHLD